MTTCSCRYFAVSRPRRKPSRVVAQLAALAAQPVANLAQRGAGVVGDLAGAVDGLAHRPRLGARTRPAPSASVPRRGSDWRGSLRMTVARPGRSSRGRRPGRAAGAARAARPATARSASVSAKSDGARSGKAGWRSSSHTPSDVSASAASTAARVPEGRELAGARRRRAASARSSPAPRGHGRTRAPGGCLDACDVGGALLAGLPSSATADCSTRAARAWPRRPRRAGAV